MSEVRAPVLHKYSPSISTERVAVSPWQMLVLPLMATLVSELTSTDVVLEQPFASVTKTE